MRKLGGWQRLFLVFSIASALAFTALGFGKYQQESREIYESSRALLSTIVPPDRQMNDLEASMLRSLRKREDTNLTVRIRDYGALWVLSLLVFAAAISIVRFVQRGFKPTKHRRDR